MLCGFRQFDASVCVISTVTVTGRVRGPGATVEYLSHRASRNEAGQSHMAFTRLIGWLAMPLPLAGSRTLPRKRERERSADIAAPWASYAIALPE